MRLFGKYAPLFKRTTVRGGSGGHGLVTVFMGKFSRRFFLVFLLIGSGCGQTVSSKIDRRSAMQLAEAEKADHEKDKKKSRTRELDDSELPWGRPADWETEMPLAPGISY